MTHYCCDKDTILKACDDETFLMWQLLQFHVCNSFYLFPTLTFMSQAGGGAGALHYLGDRARGAADVPHLRPKLVLHQGVHFFLFFIIAVSIK